MGKVNVIVADRSSTKLRFEGLEDTTTYEELVKVIQKRMPTFKPEKETLKSGSMGKMTKGKTLADFEGTNIYFELSRT
ncbi:hypothetical protein IW140_003871 [Coemansia sp. RSA 1813]|nr:hypothetical protein EV178_004086 [Coemansia sp. RSA 1646]KAJ2087338.1 hypothetical protein IW138_005044 [Coemansia sp. RSA 986]KAJ2568443.1 hypothetical protein IW140_003871 [Coemansia sp. RSA 1813]